MDKQDEVRIQLMEYLEKHPKGRVSDLLEEGYESKMVNEMKTVGIISVTEVSSKDEQVRYNVTDLGKRYFKVII